MIADKSAKSILSSYKLLQFEEAVCKTQIQQRLFPLQNKLWHLRQKINSIENLLGLLDNNEAFTVYAHIIEGLDWPQVQQKYKELWKGNEKSIRSLQLYQARGLKKIEDALNRAAEDGGINEVDPAF